MPVRVKADLVEGSSYIEKLDGILQRRPYKVQLVTPPPASAVAFTALQAHDEIDGTFVPQVGSPHPTIPDLICEGVEVMNIDNSRLNVDVMTYWRDSAAWVIRVDGVTTRELTRFDAKGDIMNVQYKPGAPPSFHPGDNNAERVPGVRPMEVQFEVLRPNTLITLERPMWQGFDPERFHSYLYCTNKTQWQKQGPHTWMFQAMQAVRLDVLRQSNIWRVALDFRFQGRRTAPGGGDYIMTWDPVAWYEDASTRRKFPEIDPKAGGYPQNKVGNGWKSFEIYHEKDFNELGLPEVFSTQPPNAN